MSRTFRLKHEVVLHELKDFQQIDVWVPIPSSNEAQAVEIVANSLPVGSFQKTREHKFGNSMLYFTVDPAVENFKFCIVYEVRRKEWRTHFDAGDLPTKARQLSAESRQLFLQANRLVPIQGKPLALLPSMGSSTTTLQRARALYNRVESHVAYDKSKPGYGHGDVNWVCDSRTGNCTDFHSLFISLARSQEIPARFEIGFPLPPERGVGTIAGYHCWAWFFDQQFGWTPVDISEADKHPELKEYYFGNLTENRVGFSVGRDLVLEPPQAGPELNYFVSPYVEADKNPLDQDRISSVYEYEDL
ncbi:MAG: transglutaminase domain-containing protein [Planctomycetes bacterium]|nr:transglutaminase domain-containing protein [Planctomycetota bacterium]